MADRWLGLRRLELTCYVDNTPALALYRRFGFEVEGTHRAYALRDGRYVDAYSMARLGGPDLAGSGHASQGRPGTARCSFSTSGRKRTGSTARRLVGSAWKLNSKSFVGHGGPDCRQQLGDDDETCSLAPAGKQRSVCLRSQPVIRRSTWNGQSAKNLAINHEQAYSLADDLNDASGL
jgi:hypothetical protein